MKYNIVGQSAGEKTMIKKMCLNIVYIIIIIIVLSQSFAALSSAASDNSELMKLITQNEDPRMDVKDLAFFLITHDFDAAPKKDHVEVQIDGTHYILVPNGQSSGLANVTAASLE
jgi:hypothetical protein